MNSNDADKIVEAIRKAACNIIGWLFGIWIMLFFIFLAIGVTAKAAPILAAPEPIYEIGVPPLPPANPNVQYWYTEYVPTPKGVLPVEVFASRLRAVIARETVETVDVPEPGTLALMALAALFMVATARVPWRGWQWAEGKEPKR